MVGVCLGSGAPELALGALVLFASNMVAMILTATIVLVATGYAAQPGGHGRAYVVLAAALILVAVPMTVNSLSSVWSTRISDAAQDWLRGVPGAQISQVTVHSRTATVEVLAPSDLPPLADLQRRVDEVVPWHPRVVLVHTVGNRVEG